jgi:hypothetical protein
LKGNAIAGNRTRISSLATRSLSHWTTNAFCVIWLEDNLL